MNRRGFLICMAGILASGFAPAVVGSGVLMPVRTIWRQDEELVPYPTIITLDQRLPSRGGKSWFCAQEVVRRARQGDRIAVVASNQTHMRTLIEQVSEPLEVPAGIVYVPWQ